LDLSTYVVNDDQQNGEGVMARVLVVDDQACIRHLISKVLILDKHEVQAIGNAQSAREHLAFSQPDIVLLDLYMDGPEGFELLQDIKGQYPSLPVIIVTAYDSHRDDPRLIKADGYIVKSVEFWDEMRQKVAEVLRKRQPLAPKSKTKTASPNVPRTEMNAYKVIFESPY
jgi:two-component system response regulator AtoC